MDSSPESFFNLRGFEHPSSSSLRDENIFYVILPIAYPYGIFFGENVRGKPHPVGMIYRFFRDYQTVDKNITLCWVSDKPISNPYGIDFWMSGLSTDIESLRDSFRQ